MNERVLVVFGVARRLCSAVLVVDILVERQPRLRAWLPTHIQLQTELASIGLMHTELVNTKAFELELVKTCVVRKRR